MVVLKTLLAVLVLLFAVPALAQAGGKPVLGDCISIPKGQSIPIEVAATDSVGVTRVEFYLDGELIATFPGAASEHYKTTWIVPKRNKRTYKLRVLGYDAAGNVGEATICMLAVR